MSTFSASSFSASSFSASGGSTQEPIYLAGAARTPIGKYGGTLLPFNAPDLGTVSAKATLARAGVAPEAVEEVIFGHARQANNGPNPGRQIGYRTGVPVTSPAYTVNRACGSGLQSLVDAARAIRLGERSVVLAGGVESMSNTPYMLPKARWGYRMGHGELVDGMYRDGFLCPLADQLMGATAETLADELQLSREEQDRFAIESQRRCEVARKAGYFDAEKTPIMVQGKKGQEPFLLDEHARDGVTLESMAKLPPVFRPDGTVHAGNSSGITDGAASLLVLSGRAAERLGVTPQGRLTAWTIVGVKPEVMGIGPVPAVERLLEQTGLQLRDIDLIELNEAFAAQVLACQKALKLDSERLNVNGGSIALGHPIGCTGTRIVVTLLHELIRRDAKRGIATLCISGGMGMALLIERP